MRSYSRVIVDDQWRDDQEAKLLPDIAITFNPPQRSIWGCSKEVLFGTASVQHQNSEYSHWGDFQDPPLSEEKVAYLNGWHMKLSLLGCLDFLFIPGAYFASSKWGPKASLPMILAKGVLATYSQKHLMKTLEDKARSAPQDYPEILSAMADLRAPHVSPGGVCVCFLQNWFVLNLLKLPEAVDTIADATVAGNALQVVSVDFATNFAHSWEGKYYGLGDLIVGVGLPGTLRYILIISTSIQFFIFAFTRFCGPRLAVASSQFVWWTVMSGEAEACSLGLLSFVSSSISSNLQRHKLARTGQPNEGRPPSSGFATGVKVVSKGLVENLPTIWIQTSLFGLMMVSNFDRLATLGTLVSVCTSLITMASTAPEIWEGCTKWHGRTGFCKCLFVYFCKALVATFVLAMVLTIVYFVGVAMCPQHNFDFSELGCSTWAWTPEGTRL